jgi:hypothetical protein
MKDYKDYDYSRLYLNKLSTVDCINGFFIINKNRIKWKELL